MDNGYVNQLTAEISSLGYEIHRLKFGKKLFRLIEKKPREKHVVHIHWTHYYILAKSGSNFKSVPKAIRFYLMLLYLRVKHVKIVWTVHNLLHHERHNRHFELFVQKRLVGLIDRIIIDCPSSADELISLYSMSKKDASKIRFISRGSYVGYYPDTITRTDARKALNVPEDTMMYLFFGRVRPYKGLKTLIESYSKTSPADSLLYIVGAPFQRVEGFADEINSMVKSHPTSGPTLLLCQTMISKCT